MDTYYSEQVTKTTALVAATDHYDITLQAPVRARTISVTITITDGANAGVYRGLDDGDGYIIGNWPTPANKSTGDVNYDNGDTNVEVEIADATAGSIVIQYHQNLAQATDIPGFLYRLTSKAVRANYFILENEYSTLADYSVRRRFGEAVSDDVAAAAVGQINSAVLTSIIKNLKSAALTTGTTDWDASLPPGVSTAEHRRTFSDAIEAAVQKIDAETGRGALSFIVAGSYTRMILQSIGVEMNRKPIPGPYLIGFFQNVPVFYAPEQLVANDECIVGYRGASWFEAPVVYAPYLPIVVVKGIGRNVFNRVTGVAHAAAVDTVVEGFTSMIKIQGM